MAPRFPFWTAAGAVAAVLLVAGSWLALRQGWFPRGSPPPGGAGLAFPRGGVTPADRAEIADPPERLAWPPLEGADWYWVTLYDYDEFPIWESVGVQDPHVEFPADLRGIIARDRIYYWRVSADVGAGRVDSPLYRFRLLPPPPAE